MDVRLPIYCVIKPDSNKKFLLVFYVNQSEINIYNHTKFVTIYRMAYGVLHDVIEHWIMHPFGLFSMCNLKYY